MITDDAVGTLMQKAGNAFTVGADGVRHGATTVVHVLHHVDHFRQQADHVAEFVLLPLGLALLLLHEHHRSVSDGDGFRVRAVLVRVAVTIALLLGYSHPYGGVCGLITRVAGAGGGWMPIDYLGDLFGNQALGKAWSSLGGINDLPRYIGIIISWIIVMCSALFAYADGLILSQVQACGIAILLAVGKLCIVVSIVPGVGVAKSWAKALAQLAAWSTIAGIIVALMAAKNAVIADAIAKGEMLQLFRAAGQFVVFGVMMLAVPVITASLFSGAGSAIGGLAASWGASKLVGSVLSGGRSGKQSPRFAPGGDAEGGGAGAAAGHAASQNAGSKRPHKVSYAAMAGAAATRFAGVVRRKWQDNQEDRAAKKHRARNGLAAAFARGGQQPRSHTPRPELEAAFKAGRAQVAVDAGDKRREAALHDAPTNPNPDVAQRAAASMDGPTDVS